MEEKEVKNIETKPEEKNDTKKTKNKIRRNLVLIVLAIALVIIYIIQRGEYLEIKEIGENLDFKVVKNKYPNRGISESIKLGIKNCEESEGYMFFVGDQPLLDKKDIEKLINVFNEDTSFIVIPKYKNRFGNPVIYPKKYKEDILNLEGDKGGKSIIKSSDKIKYVDVCENTLFDIDNIDDFNNLLKRETVYEK